MMGLYAAVQVIAFVLYYFSFWPSLVFSSINMVLIYVSRDIFHDEPVIVFDCIAGLLQWVAYAVIVHATVTKVGMIYVEADFIKAGHEDVLNNLEEGLIIFN